MGSLYFKFNHGIYKYTGTTLTQIDGPGGAAGGDLGYGFVTDPGEMIAFNGALYFTGQYSGSSSTVGGAGALYKYDGTSITIAADVLSGTSPYSGDNATGNLTGYPTHLTIFNGNLYFKCYGTVWRFDGTSATAIAGYVSPLGGDLGQSVSANSEEMIVFNNSLYFTGYAAASSSAVGGAGALYKYDGANVTLAVDIYPGAAPSGTINDYPTNLTVYNGSLYFKANYALWRSDGTTAYRIAGYQSGLGGDLGPADTNYPSEMIVFKNALYFTGLTAASSSLTGGSGALYRYDGNSVTLAADIIPATAFPADVTYYPSHLTVFAGNLYFKESGAIYKFDGNTATAIAGAGSAIGGDLGPSWNNVPDEMFVFNGALYFTGQYAASSSLPGGSGALYRYDGTTVSLATDLVSGSSVLTSVSDSNNLMEYPTHLTVVNIPPKITSNGGGSTAAISVAENGIAVTTITSSDPDYVPPPGATNDVPTYSISGGADAAKFSINSSSGAIAFLSAPNFEAPGSAAGTNVYQVNVQVSDGNGGVAAQTLAVTVTDVNEAPTANAVSAAGNNSGPRIAITLAGSDPDAGGSVASFTIASVPAGCALFSAQFGGTQLVAGSVVAASANSAIIWLDTTGAGANFSGHTSFTYTAYDGALSSAPATVSLDIAAIDHPPTITSNGGGSAAAVSVTRNVVAVTTVVATDPDAGQTLSYSLVAGGDASLFQIDAVTGALSLVTVPAYVGPADPGYVAGVSNVYHVTAQVSDGAGGTATQAITVTVTGTTSADQGGAGNDTFHETAASLTPGKSIDGGPGINTLDLTIGAGETVDLTGVTIASVQSVVLTVPTTYTTDFALTKALLDDGVQTISWSRAGFDYAVTRDGLGNTVVALTDTPTLANPSGQRSYSTVVNTYTAASAIGPTSFGASYVVNTPTLGDQIDGRITTLGSSQFLATWVDAVTSARMGQVLDAAGNKVGGTFTIPGSSDGNSTGQVSLSDGRVVVYSFSGSNQGSIVATDGTPGAAFQLLTGGSGYVSATALTNGGFAIAGSTDNYTGIGVQAYDATGQKIGPQHNFATGTFNEYIVKDVVSLDNGGFALIFKPPSGGVGFVPFDASGNQTASESLISSLTTDVRWYDDIDSVRLLDGRLFVAWAQQSPMTGSREVFGRFLSATGVPLTPEFQINTTTAGDQIAPHLSITANGNIAVAWYQGSYGYSWSSGTGASIRTQLLDVNGNRIGTEQVLSTSAPSARVLLAAPTPNGGILYTWRAYDADGEGMRAREIGSDGNVVGTEILVNAATSGHQYASGLAINSTGTVIAMFVDAGGQDGSGSGVIAQRLQLPTPAGVELSSHVVYDDGSIADETFANGLPSHQVVVDNPANPGANSFSSVVTDWSAGGVLAHRLTTYDNGDTLEQTYNPDGSRTDVRTDNSNSQLYTTATATFDANGLTTSGHDVYDNGRIGDFTYYADGHSHVDTFTGNASDPYTVADIVLDDAGTIIGRDYTWTDGWRHEISYDASGNATRVVNVDLGNHSAYASVETDYTAAGVLTTDILTYDTGTVTTQSYNADGSRTDATTYAAGGSIATSTASYTAAGLAISSHDVYANGQTGDFTYNANGTAQLDVIHGAASDPFSSNVTWFDGAGHPLYNAHFWKSGAEDLLGLHGGETIDAGALLNANTPTRVEIEGLGGNDTLSGAAGVANTFWFNDACLVGSDIVTNFHAGTDVIDLRAVTGLGAFSDLSITPANGGADATIAFGGATITLTGVTTSQLNAHNVLA